MNFTSNEVKTTNGPSQPLILIHKFCRPIEPTSSESDGLLPRSKMEIRANPHRPIDSTDSIRSFYNQEQSDLDECQGYHDDGYSLLLNHKLNSTFARDHIEMGEGLFVNPHPIETFAFPGMGSSTSAPFPNTYRRRNKFAHLSEYPCFSLHPTISDSIFDYLDEQYIEQFCDPVKRIFGSLSNEFLTQEYEDSDSDFEWDFLERSPTDLYDVSACDIYHYEQQEELFI